MRAFTAEYIIPPVQMVWRLRLLLILVVAAGTVAGCRFSSEPDSEQKSWISDRITKTAHAGEETESPVTYRAEVDVQRLDGSLWVLLNGFPTYTFSKGRFTEDQVDPPINTALVGAGNQYALRIEPWVEQSGRALSIGRLEVGGRVSVNEKQVVPGSEIESSKVDSVYRGWKKKAKKKWEEYRSTLEQGALDSIRAWAERNPLTVSTTFDNEAGPDFSRIFEEAPRLPDTPATRERLVGYAMRLGSLFAEEKVEALYREHRLTFEENDSSKERALRLIEDNWLRYNWHTDFTREDLALRQWSDGRIWEIYRDDEVSDRLSKQALFLAGEDRLVGAHKVYVAQIDGELKVVR